MVAGRKVRENLAKPAPENTTLVELVLASKLNAGHVEKLDISEVLQSAKEIRRSRTKSRTKGQTKSQAKSGSAILTRRLPGREGTF